MPTKYSHDRIRSEFQKNGYILLDDYKNQDMKMKCKCEKEHINLISWKDLRRGRYVDCPVCKKDASQYSHENLYSFIKSIQYELISYSADESNISFTVKCDNGHISSTTYNKLIYGIRCRECNSVNNKRYEYSEVQNLFEQKGFTLLSEEYIFNQQKLKYECSNGHISLIRLNALKAGVGCKQCLHDSMKKNYDDIKKDFSDNNCTLLSKSYKNNREKLKYMCKCGNISYINYDDFKQGYRCGCIFSKGEDAIRKYFDNKNINYITQKTYSDCKDTQMLRFDFYVNNTFLVEYDGRQHFLPFELFGGSESLKMSKKRDVIKNKYCLDNNIKLLRISYKEMNKINKILDDYLDNFNSVKIITYSNPKIYDEFIKMIPS